MARQRIAVQVNQFIGGINTEANPLNFPDNTSFDEDNMEINKDGSRSRRLGMDLEDNYQTVDTGISAQPNTPLARSQFRWFNPGGDVSREFMVVQIGNYLAVHDIDKDVLSSTPLFTKTFSITTYDNTFSYAVVDGFLVIATGLKQPTLLDYKSGSITEDSITLLVRDFWGVEDVVAGVSLTEGLNLQKRPSTLTDAHLYNLRNQTFAVPRPWARTNVGVLIDPVVDFNFFASGKYPSNADSVIPHLLARADLASDRTVERYHASDNVETPPGTTPAPSGYFVIDALDRGASRLAAESFLRVENPDLALSVTSLPSDTTSGGPTVVAEYSGRIWYAGFSGEVFDGDASSPNLSGYIMFSQVIEDKTQFPQCYQSADPTSNIDANIVDTDGGYIKIAEAYNINSIIPLGTSLFVIAENGVWRVSGVDNNSFVATTFNVEKIFSRGSVSPFSSVAVDKSLFFWGEDAIYVITQNQVGLWEVKDITNETIQTYYTNISTEDKYGVVGYYDVEDKLIRWLYGTGLDVLKDPKELILSVKFSSFTTNTIATTGAVAGVLSVAGGQKRIVSGLQNVTVGGVNVTAAGVDVTTTIDSLVKTPSESFYCALLSTSPTLTYSFGGYTSTTFKDWEKLGGGVEKPAYLETGFISAQEGRLRKDIPYLTTYFKRTENLPSDPLKSSCIIRAKWDWTSNLAASKWSTPRQAYRPQRKDLGQDMVITRNKIRGSGRSAAFRFEAENGKDLHLYGWSFNLQSTSEE